MGKDRKRASLFTHIIGLVRASKDAVSMQVFAPTAHHRNERNHYCLMRQKNSSLNYWCLSYCSVLMCRIMPKFSIKVLVFERLVCHKLALTGIIILLL